MPIIILHMQKAVCDGCGFDGFHEEYGCVSDAAEYVRSSGGVVHEDGQTVFCDYCATPDDVARSCGSYSYADAEEYEEAWECWRRMNACRFKPRMDVPDPLGWEYWEGQVE